MTSDTALRVMTYNIHSGVGTDGVLDLERIAGVMEGEAADLIAVQEVDRHRRQQSGYADQPGWLAQRLGMHLAFGANLDDDPERPGAPRRQYGTALLSRLPLHHWSNDPLPRFTGSEQRGLLDATLEWDGVRLRVLGTHLQHDDEDERVAQVTAIREVLDERPTLLLGDLNATPEGPAYASLAEAFDDSWSEVGQGPGTTFEAEPPARRIDYVLTRGGLRARSARVVESPASDHAALVVEVAPAV